MGNEGVLDKTREAKSLRDLMQIREDNHTKIDNIKNRGTALGFKWSRQKNTKHPCIIIFVAGEKDPGDADVNETGLVPDVLEDKNRTWCFTDVIIGGESGQVTPDLLPDLSTANKKIVDHLNSEQSVFSGGIRLAFDNGNNQEGWGTGGMAVKTGDNIIGFLTNRHVAGGDNDRLIYHPHINNSPIGINFNPQKYSSAVYDFQKWYGIDVGYTGSFVITDYSFIKINDSLRSKVQPGIYRIGNVGPLKRIDLDTMDIIGQKVISVGAGRGIQRGTIIAFSYEWENFGIKYYTDILITGAETGFCSSGDSGKIIITDDEEHRPIALHWGGVNGVSGVKGQFNNKNEKNQQKQSVWGKATELGKILDNTGLKILY